MAQHTHPPFDPSHEVRPLPALWTYFILISILSGPAFPILLIAGYCRYRTLRYRFDLDESGGIWMASGVLFKKEVNVAYRRIQDIHVSCNILQRWLNIASVSIQTASGSATPEVVIEGVADPARVRDFLYDRMRGAKGQTPINTALSAPDPLASTRLTPSAHPSDDEALILLRDIRDSMAVIRDRLDTTPGSPPPRPPPREARP